MDELTCAYSLLRSWLTLCNGDVCSNLRWLRNAEREKLNPCSFVSYSPSCAVGVNQCNWSPCSLPCSGDANGVVGWWSPVWWTSLWGNCPTCPMSQASWSELGMNSGKMRHSVQWWRAPHSRCTPSSLVFDQKIKSVQGAVLVSQGVQGSHNQSLIAPVLLGDG